MSLFTITQQGRSTIQTAPEFVAPKKAAGDGPTPVTLTYTNWRGQTAERTIIPIRVWWGSTTWHPEPQWLLTAVDAEKGLERDFALKDFGHIDSRLARKVLETVNLVVSAVGIDSEGVSAMMLAGVREAIALMRAEPAPVVVNVDLATEPEIACYAVRGPDGRYRPATAAEVEAMWAGSANPAAAGEKP
ncbi:hypothetical protein [Cereibacter changlensis]|uniref:hypothetical protein n=1 Tax=Cereibacter changlensis TaxID=402884 RepID=UPI004034F4FF